MSMATIKDILLIDPSREPLVNNGQARLADQTDEKVVAELRGELKMFVCEGEFARGLDCILSEYLGNLGNSSQKAVWVSGFFGSGKSHLLKMLAHLWADTPFSDGATARGIVPEMPKEIRAHFAELDQAGRRYGGLFSAAGTLLAGSHDRVRETVLGVILRAAGPTGAVSRRPVRALARAGGRDRRGEETRRGQRRHVGEGACQPLGEHPHPQGDPGVGQELRLQRDRGPGGAQAAVPGADRRPHHAGVHRPGQGRAPAARRPEVRQP
jgi:hypothetical protein